jgi:hypothetical protein
VDGETVLEYRDIDELPPHKAHLWRPVVIEGDGSVKTTIVEPDRVRLVYSSAPVTAAQIERERERRLSLGFDYDFGDARGVHRIGTTPADMKGWGEVSTYAGALLDSGDVATTIAVVTDTGPCEVTAPEWRAIEIAAAVSRQPIWAKSFVLSQSLPTDYTADAQWS